MTCFDGIRKQLGVYLGGEWSIEACLLRYVLPFGLISFLTGLFWTGSYSDYHKVYNLGVLFPVIVLLLFFPKRVFFVPKNRIFSCFALFAIYLLITLLWSGSDNALSSLLRRPFYIVVLFYAVHLVHSESPVAIEKILKVSLSISVISAIVTLSFQWNQYRLIGMGALWNPLLTSHVYGAFACLALGFTFQDEKNRYLWFVFFTILLVLLLKTGSRTPLVGLACSASWLVLLFPGRRTYARLIFLSAVVGAFLMVFPETFMTRGLSYRPEIWQFTWERIGEAFWFGHGYDHPLWVEINTLKMTLSDSHNILLSVWYCGGLLGFVLWLFLYCNAVYSAWQKRKIPLVMLVSVMLVYGFAAGLTEGGSFMPRPKEQWFLIWIPMSLLAAATGISQKSSEEGR